jgi:2-polyprenyl-6-methoxyphenol hydroxylase-like FAD-dependent oxidoreductase
MIEAEVVIVGGGPVGLFLACELGCYGIPCVLVNDGTETARHPRANTHSARSMELYRRHGIAAAFRKHGLPPDQATDSAYFTRLAGFEIGRIPLPSAHEAMRAVRANCDHWPTPEPQFRCTQMALEPLLYRRAMSFPRNRIMFGFRVTDIEENDDGVVVTAAAADEKSELRIKAKYCVGCDGSRSVVRRAMNIRYAGEGGLNLNFFGGQMVASYFRAPRLLEIINQRPAWQYWSIVPEQRSIILALDGKQEFLLHVQLRPNETPETFDFAPTLRRTVGADVPHEVISAAPWRGGQALVAEKYAVKRLMIAGDAAHLFTPTGGLGVNTGIEDVANLAWKLGAVCQGWAPPKLLDTYEQERHPIALRNTAAALALAKAGGGCPIVPELDEDSARGAASRFTLFQYITSYAWGEFDAPGIQLGARYDESSIICANGTPPPPDLPRIYVPSGVPGGRAPHLWLDDDRSLLDTLGHCFVILQFNGSDDARRLAACAGRRGIPVSVVTGGLPRARELYGADLVVVRPDQHVAWRGDGAPEDCDALFDRLTGVFVS